MISATIEQGQANLANLKQAVIKDNTLMPVNGTADSCISHRRPTRLAGRKNYTLTLQVGADRHIIDVSQGPAR